MLSKLTILEEIDLLKGTETQFKNNFVYYKQKNIRRDRSPEGDGNHTIFGLGDIDNGH